MVLQHFCLIFLTYFQMNGQVLSLVLLHRPAAAAETRLCFVVQSLVGCRLFEGTSPCRQRDDRRKAVDCRRRHTLSGDSPWQRQPRHVRASSSIQSFVGCHLIQGTSPCRRREDRSKAVECRRCHTVSVDWRFGVSS